MLRTLVALGLGCVLLTGCGRALPLVSHAHVGHALTAWRGTPGELGLFVVAEQEVSIALQQARAMRQTTDAAAIRRDLPGVIHALDPQQQATGPGLGYGAIRALTEAAHHLEFAETSDDASRNIKKGAEVFIAQTAVVIDNLKLALDIATVAQTSRDAELPGLTAEIERLIGQSLNGADIDGNGSIGNVTEEIGLKQIRQQLSEMLAHEDPPYQPIGRRYLLGLVKLPNGRWVYKFNRSSGSLGSSSY